MTRLIPSTRLSDSFSDYADAIAGLAEQAGALADATEHGLYLVGGCDPDDPGDAGFGLEEAYDALDRAAREAQAITARLRELADDLDAASRRQDRRRASA